MSKHELLAEALEKLEALRVELDTIEAPTSVEGVTFSQEDIDAVKGRFGDLVDFMFDIADDVRELGDDIENLFRGQTIDEEGGEVELPAEEVVAEPVAEPIAEPVVEAPVVDEPVVEAPVEEAPVVAEDTGNVVSGDPEGVPLELPLPAPIAPAAEEGTTTETNPLL